MRGGSRLSPVRSQAAPRALDSIHPSAYLSVNPAQQQAGAYSKGAAAGAPAACCHDRRQNTPSNGGAGCGGLPTEHRAGPSIAMSPMPEGEGGKPRRGGVAGAGLVACQVCFEKRVSSPTTRRGRGVRPYPARSLRPSHLSHANPLPNSNVFPLWQTKCDGMMPCGPCFVRCRPCRPREQLLTDGADAIRFDPEAASALYLQVRRKRKRVQSAKRCMRGSKRQGAHHRSIDSSPPGIHRRVRGGRRRPREGRRGSVSRGQGGEGERSSPVSFHCMRETELSFMDSLGPVTPA
jgi:hypothetical protein